MSGRGGDAGVTFVGSAGVIGWPVGHSKSPVIHRFWLEALGLDGDYGRFAVAPEGLERAVKALPALGLRGVNVTVPHKVAVMAWLDRVDPLAARVGAVNTVVVEADGLAGFNTDVMGVAGPLAGMAGADALVIGAGGAARAAVAALGGLGVASLTVMNRSVERARAMLDAVGVPGEAVELGAALPVRPQLVVNASVLGMSGQPGLAFDVGCVGDGGVVFDMVYAPLETVLLRDARARGLRTIDGLEMLVAQAAAAFELFFGRPPPRERDGELRKVLGA